MAAIDIDNIYKSLWPGILICKERIDFIRSSKASDLWRLCPWLRRINSRFSRFSIDARHLGVLISLAKVKQIFFLDDCGRRETLAERNHEFVRFDLTRAVFFTSLSKYFTKRMIYGLLRPWALTVNFSELRVWDNLLYFLFLGWYRFYEGEVKIGEPFHNKSR